MIIGIIFFATDGWSVAATLISGAMAAIATVVAVIYTNYQTKKQIKAQEKEKFRQSKYVVIKPTLLLSTFYGILDRLIVQNDYNRTLLFSGKDGFEFYDNNQKRECSQDRMLLIENKTDIDINEIAISTKTILRNMDTDAVWTYETNNGARFLRGHENIIIRVMDQTQREKIISMNTDKISSSLSFRCQIEYSTEAKQRITYVY